MEKYYKDNMVGILVSPGFGAGWSTWNREYPEMIFDPEIIQCILDDDFKRAEEIAELKWPDAYLGGLKDLEVEFLEKGTVFTIEEYDGSESLRTSDDRIFIA